MYKYTLFDGDDNIILTTNDIKKAMSHQYAEVVVENDCIERIGERKFSMFDYAIPEYDGFISSTDEHIAGQSADGEYFAIFYRKTSVNNYMHYCVRNHMYDSQMVFNGMSLNPEHGVVLIDGHYCRAMTETEEMRWNEDDQYVPHDLWGNYVIL